MSRRSSKVEPRTLPPAAMFSRRVMTLDVAAWARLMLEARWAMAAARSPLTELATPGWKL